MSTTAKRVRTLDAFLIRKPTGSGCPGPAGARDAAAAAQRAAPPQAAAAADAAGPSAARPDAALADHHCSADGVPPSGDGGAAPGVPGEGPEAAGPEAAPPKRRRSAAAARATAGAVASASASLKGAGAGGVGEAARAAGVAAAGAGDGSSEAPQGDGGGDAGGGGGQHEDGAPGPPDEGLSPAQRAQIAANRNRALARAAVAAASAPGAPPLALSALLTEPSWAAALGGELSQGYVRELEAFLHGEWAPGRKPVYPPRDAIFQAFNACPFDQVRVVLLGQDPYHGPGQAMGMAFSVPRTHRPLPPSLGNMYKEAARDLGWTGPPPGHGDLSSWSVQGVLLLNTCLTVRQGEANSHAKRGWERLTDAAIRVLSQRRSGLVFLLWGKPAQAKAGLIDASRHHVLQAAHPSPLSASRGFFGCGHFSKANALLEAQGLAPIDWRPS